MDARPESCEETREPACFVCETHQAQTPLRHQKTMSLGQQRSNVRGREQIGDVGRDEAVVGTGSYLELEGPIGLLDGHPAAKASEPGLGKVDHRGTTIDRDILCFRRQVRGQQALREGSGATAELEHRLRGFKRGMRDEIMCGFGLVECLPILFGTHPIVKGLCLLMGQYPHIVWQRTASCFLVLCSLPHAPTSSEVL